MRLVMSIENDLIEICPERMSQRLIVMSVIDTAAVRVAAMRVDERPGNVELQLSVEVGHNVYVLKPRLQCPFVGPPAAVLRHFFKVKLIEDKLPVERKVVSSVDLQIQTDEFIVRAAQGVL